jgi:hypothetical protein
MPSVTKEDEFRTLASWIKSRPQCVQKLAAEFPLLTQLEFWGEAHFVIGYTEDDMLILSPVSPLADWNNAMTLRKRTYAKHFREVKPC